MYWAGLEVLLNKHPYVRGDIEKLDNYLAENNLKRGDIVDVIHLSVAADMLDRNAVAILEKAADLCIFKRAYRLKCGLKDGYVYVQDKAYELPDRFFCDLCGKTHEFYEKDVDIIYTLNFIYNQSELEMLGNKMPVMGYYADKYSCDSKYRELFSGKKFIIILHFLKDLLIFLKSCEKIGLDPNQSFVFYKPYFYPHADYIISHLQANGYTVRPLDDLGEVLGELEKDSSESILVFEDGGYVVPLVHTQFKGLLPRIIGVVEQTTRGIRNDRLITELEMPVLNVAESTVKNNMEPPYVADAVIKNIENLVTDEKLRGKRAAIIGYGTIGAAISERLNNLGMHVTVYDPSPDKRSLARDKSYDVIEEAYNAVKNQLLVIGCSGEMSISRREISNLDHKTYLVSASSDQKEIGLIELRSMSQKNNELLVDEKRIGTSYTLRGQKEKIINLLADGYPINFWYSESMPNQVSDLILAYIFLCGLELGSNDSRFDNGIIQVNDIATSHGLMAVFEDSNR